MNEDAIDDAGQPSVKAQPFRVRLPGFVADDTVGLGDAIARATARIGFRPCDGCHRRAAALNRWLVFTGRNRT
jgi:hypothetical protein